MPCGSAITAATIREHANKCLTPVYYGRYLGFDKPPHLWGGWAEMEYVDLDMLPGTKIYRLPDDMPLWLGTLAEPFTSCIRALRSGRRRSGGFRRGDTVVIQGSGPIGVLAVVAAQEMGAGRVIVRRRAGEAAAGALPQVRRRGDRRYHEIPDCRGAHRARCARSSAASAPIS